MTHRRPPTRRRDERTVEALCIILKTRFEIPPREVHLDSRFIEDLGIDAFDLPDLILALEEVFEIDISAGHAAPNLDGEGCGQVRAGLPRPRMIEVRALAYRARRS